MTLKFFKLLQRNIEDDLNIIIPSNTDFLDELVEDCLLVMFRRFPQCAQNTFPHSSA